MNFNICTLRFGLGVKGGVVVGGALRGTIYLVEVKLGIYV
jgi:hypothetical protein